jgi:hypothetical protein
MNPTSFLFCVHVLVCEWASEQAQIFKSEAEQAPARQLLELHMIPDQIISPDQSTGFEVSGVVENDT